MLSIPVRSVPFTVTQADGTVLTLTPVGDEHWHYFLSSDGQAYRYDSEHNEYQPYDADSLAERSQRAQLTQYRNNLRRCARTSAATTRSAVAKAASANSSTSAYTGSKKGLVILVNFSDQAMQYTQTDFYNQFNQEGYSEYGHIGSVHDYFSSQSYGLFDLTFDVVGPVTLSQNLSYYGQNDSSDNDKNACKVVTEACQLVDSMVDFSNYDWDGDGEVDQVYILYAGYGENANTKKTELIWPHEFDLTSWYRYYGYGSGPLTLDGVTIDTYAMSCELSSSSGNIITGIGTACHEFSHCLGFPDFYDVSGGSGFGMSYFDLMCSGSYNGPNNYGEVPAGYTSYERWVAGWLTPVELTKSCTVSLADLGGQDDAYIIYNEANTNEYYMLENRQNQDWFTYPYLAHGMLVIHVDYNQRVWLLNQPNDDPDHQRMTYFPADNVFRSSTTQLQGDLYPGTSNNTTLSETSTPAATLYNANADGQYYMPHTLTNITETDGVITFQFDGGEEDAIQAIETSADPEGPAYDLLGRRAADNHKGFTVRQGKIVLQR